IVLDNSDNQSFSNFLEQKKKDVSVKTENEIRYTGGKFAEDFDRDGKLDFFFLMPLDVYNRLSSQKIQLGKSEILVYSDGTVSESEIEFGSLKVAVKEYLTDFPINNNYGGIYGNT